MSGWLLDDGLVEVGRYSDSSTASTQGLVILAMGMPYWLAEQEGDYILAVKPERADQVRSELARSEQENQDWPPLSVTRRMVSDRIVPGGSWSGWGWILALGLFYWFQGMTHGALLEAGSMDAQAVGHGQAWRVTTALTLHLDAAHLVGNAVAGAFLIALLHSLVGAGPAWFFTILSGTLGNTLNFLVYHAEGHLSAGASTATFGILGVLVGHAVVRGLQGAGMTALKARLVPLLAGLAVLAMTGGGGPRTDILAHFWGFGAGLAIGAFAGWFWRDALPGVRFRWAAGLAAAFITGAAWGWAWVAGAF